MGFLELLVIGIIALIVLGPERLPKAARTVGMWVGKAKQSFNSIKTEIDRELKVQELQQQIKEQQEHIKKGLGASQIEESLGEAQETLNSIAGSAQKSVKDIEESATELVKDQTSSDEDGENKSSTASLEQAAKTDNQQ